STIHVTPGGGNLVANSEFDEGATDWVLYDWASGGGSTLAIVQDADLSGSNAAKATIGNTDNSGWKIKLQQHLNFRLELGKTYEISFIARAASPRKIKAAFS